MAFDITSMVAEAAKTAPNMNEAQSKGGYTPPEVGHPTLRLVGYYEVGQHEEKFGQAKGKVKEKVELVWELSGKKYPASEDGTPIRIKQELTKSLNEKATYFKLFKTLNAAHGGAFTHFAQLLGKAFMGTIEHNKKGEGEKARTYANLVNIRKAVRLDEDNEEVPITVPPALTELKGFLWDYATPEMWDSIFIEGEWEERKNDKGEVTHPAKTKNVIQAKIMSAINFKGCPIYDYATGKVSAADQAAMKAALDNIAEGEAAQAEDALAEVD